MSDINSSLIGFLKKKSLFNASPQRNTRRKSKSKDNVGIGNYMSPRNQFQRSEKSLKNLNTTSTKNLRKQISYQNIQQSDHMSEIAPKQQEVDSPIRYLNKRRNSPEVQQPIRRNFNIKNPQERGFKTKPQQLNMNIGNQHEGPNVWSNLVNHANKFQSARLQSKQCLDSLSVKLTSEISNINYKIDVFHSKLTKILNEEFKNLHTQILDIIDKVFNESQANIRMYIKEQEEMLAGEILQMKQKLKNQYQKVEQMREDINKPQWKKVAGQLLSTELEDKIQDLVARSKAMDIRNWQIGDLGANQIKGLEYQIKEMVSLNSHRRARDS